MRREVVAILALLAALASLATASEFSVRSWQSEDGLPGNVVRSVVQSTDGFLWVASPEGIARFDGIDFEPLKLPADFRLPRIGPNRLFATPGGVVWFSGPRGSLLRIEDGNSRKIWDDEELGSKEFVTQVIAMDDRRIVARRGEEIWIISEDTPRLLPTPDAAVHQALADDLSFRASHGRIMPEGTVDKLQDGSGRIWSDRGPHGIEVSTSDGSRLDLDIGAIGGSITVSEFLEDRDNNVWIATPLSGLLRFRMLRAVVMDQSEGLTDRAITAVIQGPDGDLWIGLRSSGVDREGKDGVRHFEFAPETSGPRRSVAALSFDHSGTLWVATRDGSVFRWNGGNFELGLPHQPGFTKMDAIYQDSLGTLWMGGPGGLARVEGQIPQWIVPASGLPQTHITLISGDADGGLWIGTMDGRVFRGSGGKFRQLGGADDLGSGKISALHVEDSNHAWAATLGNGIHFWDGSRWHRFDRDDGMPDPRVTCILTDKGDDLWLGSLGGIFRVSRTELLARIRDPQAQAGWLRVDRSDGLPTRECSGAAQPSGWKASDGRLAFPTSRGLVWIDPARFEANSTAPPVFIRNIRANGRPIRPSKGHLTTGPGRTRLEFGYHGLGFGAPEKMSYRTRLLGLDDSWRETGNQRESTFEAVPPGKYVFQVSATNGDGVRSALPAEVEITVTPRFWETAWFKLLAISVVIAAAAGTGWIIARIRMKRRIHDLKIRQSLQAERARISRDLHDDLGASLTELSILSALAAENPDDASLRPSLNQFSGKAKTVVGTLDEIVWAATPAEDSLRSLVEYLSAFAREFLENAGVSARTEVPRQVPDIPIGPNRRHNVFLAARESLNNAVKHAAATEIRLGITIDENLLTIRITDNGRGFDVEYATSGDGLGNLKKRMTDCGGSCTIESIKPGGSVVTLTLPLPPLRNGA